MFDRRTMLAGCLCSGIALRPAWAFSSKGKDDPHVDAFVRANSFHGVVVKAREGRIHYARAFGMADIAAKRPARVDTVYAIASISKWLTSVTLLKLIDVLDDDDDVQNVYTNASFSDEVMAKLNA